MNWIADFQQQFAQSAAQRYCIALSGGLDSTALLSLLAKQREIQPHLALRAIHIHHGLSPNADSWAAHCRYLCAQFSIPLVIEYVKVDTTNGVEAGAREARYQAIARHIQPNEILVTAHHLQDQSETFLLALKRGSGLQGLSAMQPYSQLFGVPIFRPLLLVARQSLEDYVQSQGLTWIDDESNADNRYDRNFLRNEILPALHTRWPHWDRAVQRSAQHCAEQQQLIHELLEDCFHNHCQTPLEFQLLNFTQYSSAKQTALLRMWLAHNQFEMPSQAQLMQLIQNVASARNDAAPQWQFNNKMIRRYQSCLYITPIFADLRGIRLDFTKTPLSLPDGLGEIKRQENAGQWAFHWQQHIAILPKTDLPVSVGFGYVGKVKIHPKRPRETMKKIWQDLGVPPWMRTRIPLIFYGEQLQSAMGFFRVLNDD